MMIWPGNRKKQYIKLFLTYKILATYLLTAHPPPTPHPREGEACMFAKRGKDAVAYRFFKALPINILFSTPSTV